MPSSFRNVAVRDAKLISHPFATYETCPRYYLTNPTLLLLLLHLLKSNYQNEVHCCLRRHLCCRCFCLQPCCLFCPRKLTEVPYLIGSNSSGANRHALSSLNSQTPPSTTSSEDGPQVEPPPPLLPHLPLQLPLLPPLVSQSFLDSVTPLDKWEETHR